MIEHTLVVVAPDRTALRFRMATQRRAYQALGLLKQEYRENPLRKWLQVLGEQPGDRSTLVLRDRVDPEACRIESLAPRAAAPSAPTNQGNP